MNFANFLRTPSLKIISGRLLLETWKYFARIGKNFRRAGKILFCQERPWGLKSHAKNFSKKTNALRVTLFALTNAKIIILTEKGFGCGNFYGETLEWRVSYFGYLIMSSSSSKLLLDILIFHSDVFTVFVLFLIGCIQQFYWLIILSNNFFRFLVEFFRFLVESLKRTKIFCTRKRNYCVVSRCACAKLKIFLSAKKFLKWTPALTINT